MELCSLAEDYQIIFEMLASYYQLQVGAKRTFSSSSTDELRNVSTIPSCATELMNLGYYCLATSPRTLSDFRCCLQKCECTLKWSGSLETRLTIAISLIYVYLLLLLLVWLCYWCQASRSLVVVMFNLSNPIPGHTPNGFSSLIFVSVQHFTGH